MNEYPKIRGDWYFYEGNRLIRVEKNDIVQGGLNAMAAMFIGEQNNNLPFYLALGTGTKVTASTDITLQTEVFRKLVSAKQRQGSVVKLRTFLLQNEANSTWTELGIFVAGTDQLNSGTLLNRLTPTGGISKSSNQVLTVECRITFLAG